MSWIESHQKLKEDARLFDLMTALGWSKAEVIGRLHMLWWWCVDHAEDGDLRKFNDAHLALAVELNADQGKPFIEALLTSGFCEREPYFRLHNWWKFVRRFMQQRYKDTPDRWKRIEALYDRVTVSVTVPVTGPVTQETLPNRTIPNRTEPNRTKRQRQKPKDIPPPHNGDGLNLPSVADIPKPKPQHVDFVDRFKTSYESVVGLPFKAGEAEFTLASKLVSEYGYEAVVLKAKMLAKLCRDRSAWFTKGGWSDYTIKKLSSEWNSIIPQAEKPTKEDEEAEALRKVRENDERSNRIMAGR